ncbi:MAG: acyltransferase [Saccharofermentans sp.]|nr:acyltransferase [Saccharofermentans sp.]
MDKRDTSVEFLRIMAMIIVIGCHVNAGSVYFDRVNPVGVGISCLVADGVTVFWMIMGFFLFKSNYRHVLNRACKHVLIPMFAYTALMFYFGDWLAGDTDNILYGLTRPLSDYQNLLMNGLLKWAPVVKYDRHFWFLYSYMIIILFFPALNGVVNVAKGKKNLLIMAGILFGIIVVNDIGMNDLAGFSHAPFNGALGGMFIVLIGYAVYSMKDLFEYNPVCSLLGLIGFFIVNLVRCRLQYNITLEGGSIHLLYWFSSFGILNAFCLVLFAYGIKGLLDKKVIRKIVLHLGRVSMPVYFVHMLVLARLTNLGLIDKITAHLSDKYSSIILVHLAKMGLLFVSSLAVVEIYYWLKTLVLKAVHRNGNPGQRKLLTNG